MTTITVCASNLTEDSQIYEGSSTRILQTLLPDIILMNEFNIDSRMSLPSKITSWVHSTFGVDYYWMREQLNEDESIPNGIISKYPILVSGQLRDDQAERDHVFAQIKVNQTKLWVFSVHLPTNQNKRKRITNELMGKIFSIVPLAEHSNIILGGDFNATSENDVAIEKIREKFKVDSLPVDYHERPHTNRNRNKPYDWVLTTGLNDVPYKFLDKEFTHGFVYDTRIFTEDNMKDYALWRKDDSDNHQHMAVVRSFKV